MEYGTIERELHIEASPEVVFDVISRPEHIRDWWSAETGIEPVAGSTSELTWRDEASGRVDVVPITVIDVQPPRLFSFRWTQGPAVLEEAYQDHVTGWDFYLPRIAERAAREMSAP